VRERILARLSEQIAGSDKLTATKRREHYGALATKPAFKRLLRQTATGKLRIDRAAVTSGAKLDGKFSAQNQRREPPATRRSTRPSAAGAT
jgi:hypothetical protein